MRCANAKRPRARPETDRIGDVAAECRPEFFEREKRFRCHRDTCAHHRRHAVYRGGPNFLCIHAGDMYC